MTHNLPQTPWYDRPMTMTLEQSANLMRAVATGAPLEDTCPAHFYPTPRGVTWETNDVSGVVTVTFHPCDHQAYPQLAALSPSRYLNSPISRRSA
jgi:hypothetical protein